MWWNGRHDGLRSHFFGVWVQIPPPAPAAATAPNTWGEAAVFSLNARIKTVVKTREFKVPVTDIADTFLVYLGHMFFRTAYA